MTRPKFLGTGRPLNAAKAAPAETDTALYQNRLGTTPADRIHKMHIQDVVRRKSSRNHWATAFIVSTAVCAGLMLAKLYFPQCPPSMLKLQAALMITSICTGALALLEVDPCRG